MTIDQEDYEPRPADDYHSGLVGSFMLDDEESLARLASLTAHFFESEPARCDQLGCEFGELPHG